MKKLRVVATLVLTALVAGAVAQDELAVVDFLVLKDDNNKPVRNASVIMHHVNKDGRQERGGLELKTDIEGKASYDAVPFGKIRIQVLARGFQTYGNDIDINKPNMTVNVRLKRPQQQYSIYEDRPGDKKDESKDKAPDSNKAPDSSNKPPQ